MAKGINLVGSETYGWQFTTDILLLLLRGTTNSYDNKDNITGTDKYICICTYIHAQIRI